MSVDPGKLASEYLQDYLAFDSGHPIERGVDEDDPKMVLLTLIHKDPVTAWTVVVTMIEQAPDLDTVSYLGADALEDLLHVNGPVVLDRLLARFAEDPRFRRALCSVWASKRMASEVETQVRRLQKEARAEFGDIGE